MSSTANAINDNECITHTLAQASSAVAQMEDALRRAHEENKLLEQRLQEAKQVRYSTYVCTKEFQTNLLIY